MARRPGEPSVAAVDRAALTGALLPVAAGVLPAFLVGALAVQIRADIGFEEGGLGLLTGIFFAGGAVSSATLGRMAERHGAIRAMRLGAIASASILILIAAAGRSYGALLGLLAAAGAANALIQPAANLYLARAIPPQRQGLAFGIKQSAIPAGALLGGLAVPAIGLTLGWRWAFVGAAALAAISTIVLPDRQPQATPPVRVDPALPTTDAPRWITLCFAIGAVFAAGTAGVLGAFLVSGAVELGLAESLAGLLAAGAAAVSIASRLLLGARADRRGGRHLRVVAWMLASGSVAFALLASGTIVVFVLAAPLAYALSWSWPGLFNLSMVRHHPQAPGAATGITQTGVYLGAVAGPLAFGLVAEGGYGGAWLMAGAWSVVAGALIGGARVLLVRHREAGAQPLPAGG